MHARCARERARGDGCGAQETGIAKLFSANITDDDPVKMAAHGKYILPQSGPMAEHCDFFVDGYFSKQFSHYHRAEHSAVQPADEDDRPLACLRSPSSPSRAAHRAHLSPHVTAFMHASGALCRVCLHGVHV